MEPSSLKDLAEGIDIPCEFRIPAEPPPWLDKAQFYRGQEFFRLNPISVLASNYRNLVIGLSVSNLCDILVLTQRSETKRKAYFRYIETGYYMTRWLLGPAPWEEDTAYKAVNEYHIRAALSFRNMTKEERHEAAVRKLAQLDEEDKIAVDEDIDRVLLQSIKDYGDKNSRHYPVYERYMRSDVAFSQFDMAMVQTAFFASLVGFPKNFGAGSCSRESLEDFLHLWRVIGHYLSVEDRFNPVRPTYSDTRVLLEEILEEVVKPSLLNLNETSLHMAKCVTRAYNTDYHLLVYNHFLCYHGVELDYLWGKFSWRQKLQHYWRKFFLEWLYCVPLVRQFMSRSCLKVMERMHLRLKGSPAANKGCGK